MIRSRPHVFSLLIFAAAALVACGGPGEGLLDGEPLDGSEGRATARVVEVPCGTNLATKINGDPSTTPTTFVLGACNYNVSQTLIPKEGDGIRGPVGTFTRGVQGYRPRPLASITGVNGVTVVMKPRGRFTIEWVEVSGAKGEYANGQPVSGTGSGIAMGGTSDASLIYACYIHDNEGVGVSNMRGVIDRSWLDKNGTNPDFLGFIASGVKGIYQFEIKYSTVTSNGGNGVWCDVGCQPVPARTNGFWVHHNDILDNSRAGVRHENAPTTALIEDNEIHGNSLDATRGGVSIHDAQNATIRRNVFGAGMGYPKNGQQIAVRASDSGRSDRVDTRNVTVVNNTLNGERIVNCGGQVACSGNTP